MGIKERHFFKKEGWNDEATKRLEAPRNVQRGVKG